MGGFHLQLNVGPSSVQEQESHPTQQGPTSRKWIFRYLLNMDTGRWYDNLFRKDCKLIGWKAKFSYYITIFATVSLNSIRRWS